MRRYLLDYLYFFLLLMFFSVACQSDKTEEREEPISIIAFGSCDHQYNKEKLWNEVLAQKPQLWIWGGDIVYGDTDNMDTLRNKYAIQKGNPGYQELLSNTIITGIYDDHDYGINDGGKYYAQKKESRDILLEFLDVPKTDPVWDREGAYSAYTYGPEGKQVKILNLDTRYFRDTLHKEYYINPETERREYKYVPNEEGDVLGEAQWKWLEEELNNSTATFNIINSSIQVISSEHRFEKWANFPAAHQRLYTLISNSPAKGIFIISGDRHIASLSKIELTGMKYPLYDFTASGLTHTWREPWPEENKYRVGDLIIQRNFGLIKIDWNKEKPELTLQVRGHDDAVFEEHVINLL
jgi:alkaline phosphatase D